MKYINQTFIILFFLIGVMLTLSVGCQFDKIDLVGGSVDTTDTIVIDTTDTTTMSDCDPNVVYFQRDVLPIIASSCAKSGCHDVITHEEGIVLDNFTNIIKTGKIKGGNLNSGDFYKVIIETKDTPKNAITFFSIGNKRYKYMYYEDPAPTKKKLTNKFDGWIEIIKEGSITAYRGIFAGKGAIPGPIVPMSSAKKIWEWFMN